MTALVDVNSHYIIIWSKFPVSDIARHVAVESITSPEVVAVIVGRNKMAAAWLSSGEQRTLRHVVCREQTRYFLAIIVTQEAILVSTDDNV